MYDRILVPLDGSALAESVLPHATAIAKKFGATLVLMRVTPSIADVMREVLGATPAVPDILTSASVQTAEAAHAAERQVAVKYLEEISSQLSTEGLAVHWETPEGDAAAAIIDYARDHQVDLIALSTRGRSGLGRLVFGSVADKVLRESGRPLLLIRPP